MKLSTIDLATIGLYEDLTTVDKEHRVTFAKSVGYYKTENVIDPKDTKRTLKAARKAFGLRIGELPNLDNTAKKNSITTFLDNNPQINVDELLNNVLNTENYLTLYPSILHYDIENASLDRQLMSNLDRQLMATIEKETGLNDTPFNKEAILSLIEQGANINAFDGFALQCAALYHNTQMMDFLIANGADINVGFEKTIQRCNEFIKINRSHGEACLDHIFELKEQKDMQNNISEAKADPESEPYDLNGIQMYAETLSQDTPDMDMPQEEIE